MKDNPDSKPGEHDEHDKFHRQARVSVPRESPERPLSLRLNDFLGIVRVEVPSRDSPPIGHYWRPRFGENRQYEQRFNNFSV